MKYGLGLICILEFDIAFIFTFNMAFIFTFDMSFVFTFDMSFVFTFDMSFVFTFDVTSPLFSPRRFIRLIANTPLVITMMKETP